jgi:hypothetical protein
LQVDHKLLSGKFILTSDPLEVAHDREFTLHLKFIIDTYASEQRMRELMTTGQSVHFNLDSVRVTVCAMEDPEIDAAELYFPQQYWKPKEVRT